MITPEQQAKINALLQQKGVAMTPSGGSSVYNRIQAKVAERTKTQARNFMFDVPMTRTPETQKQRIAQAQEEAKQAKEAYESETSPLGYAKNFIGGAGRALFSSAYGLGESAEKVFGTQAEGTAENISKVTDANITLLKTIRERESKGQDVTNLKKQYNDNVKFLQEQRAGLRSEEKALPTMGKIAGQGLGTAVDVLGFATLPGKATVGMKAGTLAKARPTILPKGQSGFFTKQTAKEVGAGAGFGYGYDVGQNLQEGKTGMDVMKPGMATALGAGIPLAGRGLPAIGKTLQKGYGKTGQILSPERTMERVVGLNKLDYQKFKQKTGKSVGQYLNEVDAYGNIDEISEKLATRFQTSKGRVDSRLAMIDGVYQPNSAKAMAKDLILREKKLGVPGKDSQKVISLSRKLQDEGLTMSEINELKRLYERNVKFGYNKAINPDKVERATRLDNKLREWQFQEASKRGFKDLPALNKETQASKELLNAIGKKYAGDANNAITLTDWIVLSGGDPTSVSAYIAKKTFQSKGTQSAFAKWRYEGRPKTPLPAGRLTPRPQRLALPAGTRGQGSQVFEQGVIKVSPKGSGAGQFESISGRPIASSEMPLPQQNTQKILPTTYTDTIPQTPENINPQQGKISTKPLIGAGVGSLSGIEKDEQGNYRYNAKKGLAGALGGAFLGGTYGKGDSRGMVKLPSGKIVQAVDDASKREMMDMIDYARLGKKKNGYNQEMENMFGDYAEKYGFTDKNIGTIANKLERIIEETKTLDFILGTKKPATDDLLSQAKKDLKTKIKELQTNYLPEIDKKSVFESQGLGYSGNRSVNAKLAESGGEYTSAQLSNKLGIKESIIKNLVPKSSAHHVGSSKTLTDFYNINAVNDSTIKMMEVLDTGKGKILGKEIFEMTPVKRNEFIKDFSEIQTQIPLKIEQIKEFGRKEFYDKWFERVTDNFAKKWGEETRSQLSEIWKKAHGTK